MSRGLGRLLRHDPKSRTFPARRAPEIKTVRWFRNGPILDQGDLGACTGYAMAGALMTRPLYKRGRKVSDPQAKLLYSDATRLDPWPRQWEPEDTGSSGLAVCAAAKALGYITGTSGRSGSCQVK